MGKITPTIKDLICHPYPITGEISPDGKKVAFILVKTNWSKNRYERICYIYDIETSKTFQLTQGKSITSLRWYNNSSLAMLKSLDGVSKAEKKEQIWVYEELYGDGSTITDQATGIQAFEPYERGFVYLANNLEKKKRKKRKKNFGNIIHVEEEESTSALYYVSIDRMKQYQDELYLCCDEDEEKKIVRPTIEITKGHKINKKIEFFIISDENKSIYFNCREKDDLVFLKKLSSYKLELEAEKSLEKYLNEKTKIAEKKKEDKEEKEEDESIFGELTELNLPAVSRIVNISPDGTKILIHHKERDDKFFTQGDLWIIKETDCISSDFSETGSKHKLKCITRALDQEISSATWSEKGIYVSYYENTVGKLASMSENGEIKEIDLQGYSLVSGVRASKNGCIVTIAGSNTKVVEVIVAEPLASGWKVTRITDNAKNVEKWDLGTSETIQWKSKDGTIIEGILRKPANFDSKKKYPLLLVVHGGPSWLSQDQILTGEDIRFYPTALFINEDILILKPNYRGSLGRGQSFLELNKENLGIGDLWDIESGVDYLVEKGFVDETKVGCSGWSQGGYISAFVATNSKKFVATSVGAGVSSWYTYYIGTDIRLFTEDYLSALPHENMEIYMKTAPMSKIKDAETPTLIQHGENDQRVPFLNATELYRGLKSIGVHVEFFKFPGMGHGINKPKENYAVMHQNLTWFLHHLKGEELNFFEIEKKEKEGNKKKKE